MKSVPHPFKRIPYRIGRLQIYFWRSRILRLNTDGNSCKLINKKKKNGEFAIVENIYICHRIIYRFEFRLEVVGQLHWRQPMWAKPISKMHFIHIYIIGYFFLSFGSYSYSWIVVVIVLDELLWISQGNINHPPPPRDQRQH